MKRIEFVLCLFFISTVSFAQKEIAPTKNLDAYIGTWMYQSNDTIFKIVLKKGYAEDQHMIINGLMGGYFLSVKGIIVENYFSIRDTIWHLDKNEGGNLAASKIRNLECPNYEICLIDYGCGKFNRKIHIMEQYP